MVSLDERKEKKASARNECACFDLDLRRTTRAVTRMYDDCMRGSGLTITQFSLVRLIAFDEGIAISSIGRSMLMDRTSVRRALDPLEKNELVCIESGEDRRVRAVRLTVKGRLLLAEAEPRWLAAQESLLKLIGTDRWDSMRKLLRDTARLVIHRDDVQK